MTARALRPDTVALTALLAFLMAFGPLSIDLLVPLLPEIGRVFSLPASQVQLTLSLYLASYAVAQMVCGPLSDRFGRKIVILVGLLIYCVGSIIGGLAHALEGVLVGRIIQALGVAGVTTVARAVVRDLYDGARAGHQFSIISTIMGLAPIVMPLAGGILLVLLGWRAGFAFQFLFGATAFVLVVRYLAETRHPSTVTLTAIASNYRTVATSPVFLANMAMNTLSFSSMFPWLAGSSFVLQSLRGLSPLEFSILYAVACVGFMVGGAIATRLVLRIGLDKTAGLGAAAQALAGAALLASVALETALPITMTASMTLCLCGMGMVVPQATAGALTPFPRSAGIASALLGFAQLSCGALVSVIVGHALDDSAWPIAIGSVAASWATLILWAATRASRVQSVARTKPLSAAE